MDIRTLEVSSLEFLRVLQLPDLSLVSKCSEVPGLIKLGAGPAEYFLYHVFALMFSPGNSREPFTPFLKFGDEHSPAIGDFNGASLFCLAAVCNEVENPELRARICDLIWCQKNSANITLAHLAVAAYLESAKILASVGDGFGAIRRVERALRLGYMVRRAQGSNVSLVTDYLAEVVKSDEVLGCPEIVLKLSYEFCLCDPEYLYGVAHRVWLESIENGMYRRAIAVAEIAINCARQLKDKQKEYNAYLVIAECYEAEADLMPSGLGCGSLMSAIEALRAVPETRERQDKLYSKLRDHQRSLQHNMSTISLSSGDLSDIVNESVKLVQGRDFIDSIFRLVLAVHKPTKIDALREIVVEGLQDSIFLDFGAEHIDGDGLPVATTPGIGESSDARVIAIEHQVIMALQRDHQMAVRASILPAIEEIANTYYVGRDGWAPFLTNNHFVPRDHIEFFDRGLTAGLNGDFLLAAHLLIPQVENSLRYMISQSGQEPTRLFGNGDQDREGLKSLLESPVVESILGVDTTYALRAILLDKVYGDLRNMVSHGYATNYEVNSDASVMLWWFVLWIIVVPYRRYWLDNYGDDFFSSWPERAPARKRV